jgi:hypothetical protein
VSEGVGGQLEGDWWRCAVTGRYGLLREWSKHLARGSSARLLETESLMEIANLQSPKEPLHRSLDSLIGVGIGIGIGQLE